MTDPDLRELLDRLVTMEARLRELEDLEAIREVKYAYCRLADNGRYDEFADLFSEDYTCELNFLPLGEAGTPNVMRFESKAAWTDFVRRNGAGRAAVDAAARADLPGGVTNSGEPGDLTLRAGMVHHMHGGKIELTGPDSARAIWPSYFGDGDGGTVGYYDEEYRREDGRWRIARERFYAQALRAYKGSDRPYPLEVV
jgi:hypothetical protein